MIRFKFSMAFELAREVEWEEKKPILDIEQKRKTSIHWYITLLRNGSAFSQEEINKLEELACWLRDGFSYLLSWNKFTPRERSVIKFWHLPSKDIIGRLPIEEKGRKRKMIEKSTVDVHRNNIREKIKFLEYEPHNVDCWLARNSLRFLDTPIFD